MRKVLSRGYEVGCLLAVVAVTVMASCTAQPAVAGTLGLHIGSQHIPNKDYNNFNPGAYYRTDEGWTVGGYRNSYKRSSVYGGHTWERGDYGLTAGAITGYNDGLMLMVVPTYKFAPHARIAYIPKVGSRGAHVLHLMIEF